MHCKRAKQDIALSVGRDLDSHSERELQRHLASCPDCRQRHAKLRESIAVLHRASELSDQQSTEETRSVWSAVSDTIQHSVRPAKPSPFSLQQAWVPVVAIASMVLAVLSISNSLNRPQQNGTIFSTRNLDHDPDVMTVSDSPAGPDRVDQNNQ